MLDREVVERIEGLLAKATPGEWRWSENGNIYGGPEGRYADVDEVAAVYTDDEATGAPNAPLIIAAVNALPELLRVYRLWMDAQGGIVGDRIQYDDKSGGVEVDYWDGVPEVKKGDWVRLVRDGDSGEG